MPLSVHVAIVPDAPKSTSSGWAVTTRMRSTSSSLSMATNLPGLPDFVDRRVIDGHGQLVVGQHVHIELHEPVALALEETGHPGPGRHELAVGHRSVHRSGAADVD